MDIILRYGIDLILALQSLGRWLELPMQFFTFLGSQEFFLLVLPALYWAVDTKLGIRVGVILLFTSGLNNVFKLALQGPRPYWYSPDVKALASEPSFGIPSNHAQTAVGLWGTGAVYLARPWARVLALILIAMIGLSRLYLGVHFPHDVLIGWLLGAAVLWVFLHWWDAVTAWLKTQSLISQIGLAFVVSTLLLLAGALAYSSLQTWVMPAEWLENAIIADAVQLPDPVNMDYILTTSGALFGLLSGLAWITWQGGFTANGSKWQRILCYLIGLVGILVLWQGLGAVFPRDDSLLAFGLRYLRYVLVGVWISAGAPYLFLRVNLAARIS